MKKFLSVLLTVVMSMSLLSAFAAEQATTEQTEEKVIVYSEDIKILNSYGIFSEDFFADPEKKVTRGELAYILDMMSGMGIVYNTTHYPDVLSDHKYFSSIESAYQLKTMQGYLDGKFRPDENITFEMAYKTMVCLTGHSFMAEQSSYATVAANLDINEGISAKDTETVNFEQIAKIIRNTFDVVGYKMYLSGNEIRYAEDSSGKTFLENALNIYKERGTVEATYVSSINSNIDMPNNNNFKVNGKTYDQMEYDIELFLGYQVEFYYKYDKNEETNKLLYLFDVNDFNDVTTIPEEDYIDISNRTLQYYENGRKKQFTIGTTKDIILNGKLQNVYDENMFDIANGEIYIVTNQRNGKTFISIKSVSEFVAGFVGLSQINTKIGNKTIEINDSGDLKQNLVRDGKNIDITKVAENNVLEIYTDGLLPDGNVDLTDAKFITGTATINKITGIINAMYEDYINIDGTRYEISNTLKSGIQSSYIESPLMGNQYDFYLNSYGEVAYYVRKIVNNERLGIVLKTSAYVEAGEVCGYVRILEDDGTVTKYEIPEEIKVDGVAKSSPQNFVNNFNSLAKSVQNTETGEIMQIVLPPKRFIRYVTKEVPDEGNVIVKENVDGTKTEEQVMKTVLTELDTLVENLNPQEGDMVYEHTVPYGSWKRYKSSMMGNAFKVGSTTKLFYIPRITSRTSDEDTTTATLTWTGLDVEDEDNYGVGSSKFNKAGESTWFGDIYTYMMDEESVPRAAAAYPRKQAGVANIDIDGKASGSGRITGFKTVLNEEGVPALQMEVGSKTVLIEPGEENIVLQCAKQPYMSDGITPRIAREGDFIRYWMDVKGYLIGVDICISMDDMRARIPKINTLNAAGTSFVGYQDQYVARFLYGMPYRVGTSTMQVAKKAKKDSETGDYIYDSDGNLMYDFDSGSSSFEVFPATATVYLMEENSDGRIFYNQVSKGEIRTYENYGYDADRVIVASGYGGISYVVIVRLYN